MFALAISTAAILAAISAVFYTRYRSEQVVKNFQKEHAEQVKALAEEVQECRDALNVMVTSVRRLDADDNRLDDFSHSRTDRLQLLEGELENLNDRVEKISRQVSLAQERS